MPHPPARLVLILVFAAQAVPALAVDGDDRPPSAIRAEVDAALADLKRAQDPYYAELRRIEAARKAGGSAESALRAEEEADAGYARGSREGTERIMRVARAHPDDADAVRALTQVIIQSRPHSPELAAEALAILAERHALDPGVAEIGEKSFVHFYLPENEKFLREVLAKNPDRGERGRACYELAYLLQFRAERVRGLRARPEKYRNYAGPRLRELVEATVRRADLDAMAEEARLLLERCVAEFADVKGYRATPLGELAGGELFAMRNLAVGRVAPELSGLDVDGKPLRLGDHRGKVVLLMFSGDHCGPCVAMYPLLRRMVERFRSQPFSLLCVNSDAEAATLRASIRDGVITWPCWWDGGEARPITTSWGVSEFPTIFLIDRKGVIRYKGTGSDDLEGDVKALLDDKG